MPTTLTPAEAALLERWLWGRPPNTVTAYRADIAAVLQLADRPLTHLDLADLQTISTRMQAAGLAPASVGRRLAAVKSFLRFCHTTGATETDAGRALRLPRRPDKLAERIVPQEDMQALLAAVDTPRDRALLLTLYTAGVRVAECCSLRWRDLVRRDGGGQITVAQGKGGKSRVIRIRAETWQALMAIRPVVIDPDGPVFPGPSGRPLTTRRVQHIVKALAVRAGLPADFSPHWCRHAMASHSLEGGASIALVMETLGHSSLAVTQRYVHVRPDSSASDFLALDEAPAPAQHPQRARRRS